MRRLLLATAATFLAAAGVAYSQGATMSFFVTSVGSGKGADLGGIKGADALCASLAEAVGVTGKTWAAYLSTSDADARDRIGKGPWVNAKGVKIADDVASLHGDANAITKETALNEKGEVVNGRGDKPNRHDVLTGSKPDGTKIADQTCGDWTMSGAEGVAMVGHHDRTGLDDSAAAKSWNSSHASRGGCSQEALQGTGGDGLFYCFAVN
ncbi:hypothetical protein LJR234_003158 [Mesorhizobium amorphae]|uniref:hypothetical protein n=1 Tax=Mesorhizobium amorphae TaxID=71433 RepID=UPI003ED0FC30